MLIFEFSQKKHSYIGYVRIVIFQIKNGIKMKSRMTLTITLFLLLQIFNESTFAQNKRESYYEGKLKIQVQELRLVLKVLENEGGITTAKLDSPDQGAKDIPVSKIVITPDSLNFECAAIGAKYFGEIIKDSGYVKGNFTQGGMSLPLNLSKVDKPSEVKRPQLPIPPFPYISEDIIFENKELYIKLAGTLTFPQNGNSFPAVVLVSGSGPQDRDETLMNHKPFLVIADYLTRNGIAVLRYDDRGTAKSEGNFSAATTIDFASDAISAVEYLKTRKEINANKIGIIGHSEGGLIAPFTANQSDDISFIIMLAGPGVPGVDILKLQTELILRANGMEEVKIKEQVQSSSKAYQIIIDEPDSAKAYQKLKDLYKEEMSKLSDDEKAKPENSPEMFERTSRQILSPWFRLFLKFDPRPYLENLRIPVLALNGELDLQVEYKQNLPEIEKALKMGGNTKFTIKSLPGLNHLFQNAKTGAVSEYAKIEETISPEVLEIMSKWILETVK